MIIKEEQIEAFDNSGIEDFIKLSVLFLKDNFQEWCTDKNDMDLNKFIKQMIDFGEKYNIRKEINLQKLMHYKIEFNFDLFKYKNLHNTLTQPQLSEDMRIENFYLSLVSKNYLLIPITLTTAL